MDVTYSERLKAHMLRKGRRDVIVASYGGCG